MAIPHLVKRRRDGFELRLDDDERDLLRSLLDEQRSLLLAENPASDAGVARLFPPAYPDDLLQNLDFERTAGNSLLADRLGGLDTAEAALSAPRASEDQLSALMRAVNDLRLIYGTRLDITEETTQADFPDDPERSTFALYLWLSWMVEDTVRALGQS